MNLRRALLVALVGVALTAGCGDDSGSTAAEPEACAFSPGDSAMATARDVTALTLDGDTLWIGTEDDGLTRLDLTDLASATRFTTSDGVAADAIHSVAVALDGQVWLTHARAVCPETTTGYCGVSRFDGSSWSTITQDTILSDRAYALAQSPSGTLWLGAHDGAMFSQGGSTWDAWFDWQDCNSPGDHCSPLFSFTVQGVAFDAQTNDTWFAIDQQQLGVSPKPGGVARRDADGRTDTWDRDDGLPSNRATSIAVLGGIPWAGSPAGLASLDLSSQTWSTWSDLAINDLAVQNEQLWAATDEGALLLNADGSSESWTTAEGLPSNEVRAVAATDDVVCFGTSAGVGCYRSSTCGWIWP
ncbi:MAG: hypothetical protein CMH57_14310 [Myxococcales bacterium]|nr:hypothetical protein [Myxococcales bacterium]